MIFMNDSKKTNILNSKIDQSRLENSTRKTTFGKWRMHAHAHNETITKPKVYSINNQTCKWIQSNKNQTQKDFKRTFKNNCQKWYWAWRTKIALTTVDENINLIDKTKTAVHLVITHQLVHKTKSRFIWWKKDDEELDDKEQISMDVIFHRWQHDS